MNDPRVLFVDDDEAVLNALKRVFMDSGIEVVTSSDPAAALEILRNNNYPVIVSDNRMPGLSGIEFLCRSKDFSPESVRIMLTAFADLESALAAINKGEVYRFITKPWDETELREIIFDAIKQYRVAKSLKLADEATLLSLAQTIELKDPYTRGHCDRVAGYGVMLAGAFGLDDSAKRDIRHGSWLHDCGKIGIPERILNSRGDLSSDDWELIRKHPLWGADVARKANLPERVVNIILYHHEYFDGTGYPAGIAGDAIPFEARIVSVSDVFDALSTDRPYRKKYAHDEVLGIIESMKGAMLDPVIVDALFSLVKRPKQKEGE